LFSSWFVSVVICLHLATTSSEVALCGKAMAQYGHGSSGHCEEAACGTRTICQLSAVMAPRSQAAQSLT
jgi:hypothetical protein